MKWRYARVGAAACYLGALAASVVHNGVPIFRVSVIVWILGALAVYSLGRGWATFGRALLDWVPFLAVMMCYDLTRGAADRLGQPVHVRWPATIDSLLFDGTVPTNWLQDHLYRPGEIEWYDVASSLVYFSFFLAVPVVMAVLWVVDRGLWRRFTASVVLLSFAGAVTFILFPQAPPWYAAERGVIPPVDRISSLGWNDLGLHAASDLIQEGQLLANDVAAMPSLHEAYTVLVVVFFLRRVPRWSWPLLLTYPLAMGFTLAYTGEHYVIDLVVGTCYALAAHATVSVVADVWTARRRRALREHSPPVERLQPKDTAAVG